MAMIDVDLDSFDDEEIVSELEYRGYRVISKEEQKEELTLNELIEAIKNKIDSQIIKTDYTNYSILVQGKEVLSETGLATILVLHGL